MPDRGRERDLVLAPNEFAFISDETKGNINVYVGPHKTSLANTDQPVVFDSASKRFVHKTLQEATCTISIAPEGWYLVLKNPAKDGSHPRTGALNNLPELKIGRKVNIPGPISFALWPGQMVKVVQGHRLRSNQYLLVRVYDEEGARENWSKAVIKKKAAEGEGEESESEADGLHDDEMPDLTMGALFVIRGTDVAFYIPPTGLEIVRDGAGRYVREAVTLERLEYCILLDEDGNKRYIRGPDVVFPRPTENFITKNGSRKFRAIELNEINGLYLKVIAPYSEDGVDYKVGDELFITGKTHKIYFPRPEHAIIKYGAQEKQNAVAIPAGEARYVLHRLTGQITLQRGPSIFLPDPRTQVIVRRVLDPKLCKLLFPGNKEALDYNLRLAQTAGKKPGNDYVADREAEQDRRSRKSKRSPSAPAPAPKPRQGFAGDGFSRNQTFTGPRTIVLDTRYEGAVAINVWTGYAVLVVDKSGGRKVVTGPHTHLLEYDETLQLLEMSKGCPKSDENLLRTVYLRVLNNKVSDRIDAETRDLVQVSVRLKYRVNFEGEDPSKWFEVENYVKFLCDHIRSLVRNAVKKLGIQAFYSDATSILREVILGKQGDDGKRPGRVFTENNMRVYDVEVLDVNIGDDSIAELLVEAQHAAVQQTLALASEQRKLEFTERSETIAQQIAAVQSTTRRAAMGEKQKEVEQQKSLDLAQIDARAEARQRSQSAELAQQEAIDTIHRADLARKRSAQEHDLEFNQRQQELQLQSIRAEVQAVVDKAGAVSPELIAALQAFGDRALAEKMAESMAPLAILGGESVADVLARLLQGTPLARLLKAPGDGEESS